MSLFAGRRASSGDTPRLVIHAGSYKTATSSLQSFFTLRQRRMLKDFGVLYPFTGRRINTGVVIGESRSTRSAGQHTIAHVLAKISEEPDATAALEKLAAGFRREFAAVRANVMLLSSELLSFIDRRSKERLIALFPDCAVEVIYAVRNPIDYVESMNNQRLKSGKKLPGALKPIGFLRDIDEWTALLGEGKVHVQCFAASRASQFITEFMTIVGGPALAEFAQDRVPSDNLSVSHEGARLRALLDGMLPRNRDLTPVARHELACALGEIEAALPHRTRLVTLDKAMRDTVATLNADDVAAISARFLDDAIAAAFAKPQRDWDALKRNADTPAVFHEETIAAALAVAQRFSGAAVTPDDDEGVSRRSRHSRRRLIAS